MLLQKQTWGCPAEQEPDAVENSWHARWFQQQAASPLCMLRCVLPHKAYGHTIEVQTCHLTLSTFTLNGDLEHACIHKLTSLCAVCVLCRAVPCCALSRHHVPCCAQECDPAELDIEHIPGEGQEEGSVIQMVGPHSETGQYSRCVPAQHCSTAHYSLTNECLRSNALQ